MQSNYDKIKAYLKEAHQLKAKARSLKRQFPKRLGEYILSKTRQPMFNKKGEMIKYTNPKTKRTGFRMRNLHDVKEFKDNFYIVPKRINGVDTREILNEFKNNNNNSNQQ